MNTRRFRVLQSKRKHLHDVSRAQRSRGLKKHIGVTTVESRLNERMKFDYAEENKKEVKQSFFKKLFHRRIAE